MPLPDALRRSLARRIGRWVQRFRIFGYTCLSTNKVTGNVRRLQPVLLLGRGDIVCQGEVKIGVNPSPRFFSGHAHLEARHEGSRIVIGDKTWINNDFTIIAEHTSVSIGERCFIGADVEILDSDFHGLRVEQRAMSLREWARPVVIEDDVFIGSHVRVLKGVRIGRGSVVASAAVVTRDVPANVIVGGNPARIIKELSR